MNVIEDNGLFELVSNISLSSVLFVGKDDMGVICSKRR